MKVLTVLILAFFVHGYPSCGVTRAEAAPKRFKVKNEITGIEFMREEEDGVLKLQPEYGFTEREVECDKVDALEQSRIKSRRTPAKTQSDIGEPKELCTLKAQFVIVEEDVTAEREAKKAKENARKVKTDAMKALKNLPKNAVNRNAFIDSLMDLMLEEDSDISVDQLKHKVK